MKHIVPAAMLAFIALSCEREDTQTNEEPLQVPATYSFERNGASSVSFTGQVQRQAMLSELSNFIKEGTNGTALDYAEMVDMYENTNNPFADPALNTSGKSLSSKTSATPLNGLEQGTTINWFKAWMQGASNASATPTTATTGTAGVISNTSGTRKYLVNEQGVEYAQVVQKGLMGAVFMDQMLNGYLTPAKLDVDNTDVEAGKNHTAMEHHWDEAYGYFTIVQDLELDASISQARGFWGNYLVGLESDLGLASNVYYAFREGRAAIVAKEYSTRDADVAEITTIMEHAAVVKALSYLNKGKNSLASAEIAAGFHELSEGIGFIYSLRYGASTKADAGLSDGWIEELTAGDGFWAADINTRIDNVKAAIGQHYQLDSSIINGTY